MKLLDLTPLQENGSTGQLSVNFPDAVKKQAVAMGWKKGDRIAIYRHGAGFFIALAGRNEPEPELIVEKKEGKRGRDKD